MLLADPRHFTRTHYETHRGAAPGSLCELVVHCLELVGHLARSDLEFRFKGGNSLLVILDEPERFSIDVDIVTTVSKQDMIALVGRIVNNCAVFTRWESRQPRTKPWLPMISFKLFFDSVYQAPEDAFVMLDVVLEPPPYAGMRRKIQCGALYDCELEVEVPSVAGLIGDKLLTIGPATLGIPLGKGKEAQRLKHVFDVSRLAREGYDLEGVREGVVGCMAQENAIQRTEHDWPAVAEDTLRFVSEPLSYEEMPTLPSVPKDSYLYEVVKGFLGFREHVFRRDYTWGMFLDDCRRVRSIVEALGTP